MPRLSADTDNPTAAQRGQIVQRVLVDGWSAAQAAAAFGVSEWRVVQWVAAYRRHGYTLRQIGLHLDRHYETLAGVLSFTPQRLEV